MKYEIRVDGLLGKLRCLLSSRRYSCDEFGGLPDSPGVYLFRQKRTGKVIYAGRTGKTKKRTIKVRVREHFHHFKDIKKAYSQPTQKWLIETRRVKRGGFETISRAAINHLKEDYFVQCVPVKGPEERAVFERFTFAALKPPANLAKDYER